jgi:PII-like signaling protein
MENNSSALLLRIYLSSTDKYKEGLLYEHIVFKAKEQGIAGATVLKGILGYGASSVIHSYKFWEVSEKLPVVIEIIDLETKVMDFFELIKPVLESVRYGCLVATEKTDLILYKHGVKG